MCVGVSPYRGTPTRSDTYHTLRGNEVERSGIDTEPTWKPRQSTDTPSHRLKQLSSNQRAIDHRDATLTTAPTSPTRKTTNDPEAGKRQTVRF